jgi:hypothetical protein
MHPEDAGSTRAPVIQDDRLGFSFRSREGIGATTYSGAFIIGNEMDLSQPVEVFVDTF